ncbi:hypothetical protein DXG03_007515 [Asterophora parasitica]|uniref:Uncharacterized protein n=1 Tax=Asterophora parasitica TaxID=117018 RepID=A0A9P7G6R7_9AGAR|nr:hypothetical protein DXG03_007515 [Asterophora parasitica]
MSSKTRSSSAKSLRQGTLSFGSAKRTAVTEKPKAKASQPKKSPAPRELGKNDRVEDDGDIQVGDGSPLIEEQPAPNDERPTITLARPSRARTQETQDVKPPGTVPQIKNTVDQKTLTATLPNLILNDPKWRKHYAEVREQMGHMHPSRMNMVRALELVASIAGRERQTLDYILLPKYVMLFVLHLISYPHILE